MGFPGAQDKILFRLRDRGWLENFTGYEIQVEYTSYRIQQKIIRDVDDFLAGYGIYTPPSGAPFSVDTCVFGVATQYSTKYRNSLDSITRLRSVIATQYR